MSRDYLKEIPKQEETKEKKSLFGKKKKEDEQEMPEQKQQVDFPEQPKEIYITEQQAILIKLNQIVEGQNYIYSLLLKICKESNINIE